MEKHKNFNKLYDAILTLKTKEDCFMFFDDILTMKELETMAQRLDVAQMLKNGSTFNEVASKTGASTTTISRVNRCLQYGSGGYDIVIKKED